MKFGGARARAFCSRPDTGKCGALLYGTDEALVGLGRRELVASLTEGDDLRLTRLDAGQAVRDPAGLDAALRSRGFFPGRPVVLVEGAGDGLGRVLEDILPEIRPDDAFLVVTAGSLPARSALRKLFDARGDLVALAFHSGPPAPGELERLAAGAGLRDRLTPEAMSELAAAAETIDRGALLQLIEKVAVYALDRESPIEADELGSLLPQAAETELDRLVAAVADGRADDVGPLITRLSASGIGPVTMLIALERQFRLLLAVTASPDGVAQALARAKPPLYGSRRDAVAAQARSWGAARLDAAIRLLFQTDRRLRSAGERPDRALVERCLIRLAMMRDPK